MNVHEARTNLSKLLERVELGEEITIMRPNVPVARLVAADRPRQQRELGWGRGEIQVRDDFDDPLP
ncbi:MAG TPA: type II toxin-antitoxin system prevent-host-death family antitoxin, partial [Bryobacteraceae bacterium]|nr:type II toxin-antitoxin system prevent-host-death family antitoxin [Bryobacteraceae bacterium]